MFYVLCSIFVVCFSGQGIFAKVKSKQPLSLSFSLSLSLSLVLDKIYII